MHVRIQSSTRKSYWRRYHWCWYWYGISSPHWSTYQTFGVNAPDPKSHDTEERERGLASKNRLIEILPKEIIVQTMLNKRGKFGRILGIVMYKE